MKKGQMEIVGLLVVVIILAVALVVAISLLSRPKEQTLEPARQQIKIENLISSLLKH